MIPEKTTEDINLFSTISELDRQTIINSCHEIGRPEAEFIEMYSKSGKYTLQRFYYHLFKLCDLREFQRLSVVFIIGLILILIFVK